MKTTATVYINGLYMVGYIAYVEKLIKDHNVLNTDIDLDINLETIHNEIRTYFSDIPEYSDAYVINNFGYYVNPTANYLQVQVPMPVFLILQTIKRFIEEHTNYD